MKTIPDPDDDDHVARVREQWRRVRPDLDTTPAGIVARVGRLAAYFDQSTNALMTRHGLSRASWDVIASLRRVGPPFELTPTDLYRGLMRSSGAMSNRLRRLERAELVRRVPDPADGRGVRVRLTERGVALVDEIIAEHLARESRLLAALDGDARATLEALLRGLLAELERTEPTPPRSRRERRSPPAG